MFNAIVNKSRRHHVVAVVSHEETATEVLVENRLNNSGDSFYRQEATEQDFIAYSDGADLIVDYFNKNIRPMTPAEIHDIFVSARKG